MRVREKGYQHRLIISASEIHVDAALIYVFNVRCCFKKKDEGIDDAKDTALNDAVEVVSVDARW